MTKSFDSIDRRKLISTATAGYALAVCPVTAWAITTSDTNLVTTQTSVPVGKDAMPVFVARPKKSGRVPVVIVIHEIFGVHEYIKDVCRRLANEGYMAVSPYLYFREGDVSKIPEIEKVMKEVVSKVPQQQVMSDLDALVDWLSKDSHANVNALGITGFCWGGGVTWMYSAHSKKIKAGVAWYGRLSGDASPLQPKYPLDVAAELNAPVLGLYGEKDKGIPQEQVEKMRQALTKAKSPSKIIVYPGAEHGFHADYRPSYHETSAKQGWAEMLHWFKENHVK